MITKRKIIKNKIRLNHGCNNENCQDCLRKFAVVDEMSNARIPVEYWMLSMKDFTGSETLKEITNEYIDNIKKKYEIGKSICFSGNQGIGKTMCSICILRAAIKNGFKVFYISASDMLSELTDYKNSLELKNTLKYVDFLVIDELDSRFFVSDAVKELFSSIYENIFRFRSQNMLPTILCSNDGNILNSFCGHSANVIESLNNKYLEIYYLAGKDFRKIK